MTDSDSSSHGPLSAEAPEPQRPRKSWWPLVLVTGVVTFGIFGLAATDGLLGAVGEVVFASLFLSLLIGTGAYIGWSSSADAPILRRFLSAAQLGFGMVLDSVFLFILFLAGPALALCALLAIIEHC